MMRQFPVLRRWAVLAAVAFALLVLPTAVVAHAELVKATPKDGAVVEGTPSSIFATYSEAMDPSGSSLKLVDEGDVELAEGGVDPDNAKRMSIDDVPDLAPGTYTVKSTTKSDADGDIDRTEWSFTVKAAPAPTPEPTPSPTATPTATPTPTASSAATPTPTPSTAPSPSESASASPSASATASASPTTTDGSDASGGSDVLLPIIAAVVIVAVIAGFLYSRRERPPTQA